MFVKISNAEVVKGSLLSAINVAVSGIFIFYGWLVALSEGASLVEIVFAVATIGYGLSSISLLVWSWFGGGQNPALLLTLLGVFYLVIFMIFSFDVGRFSSLEIAAIISIVFVELLLWYSVWQVGKWRQNA